LKPAFEPPTIFIVLVISLSLYIAGCSSRAAAPDVRYAPAGDLLDIIKDFQRLAREDTYRFSIPKDITGVNIMKATLLRLQDYEKKNPRQFTDIIQFNKALALERLREYDQAALAFRKVAESEGRLATEAAKNAEVLDTFVRVIAKPLSAEDPFKHMEGLDEKVGAWNQLIQKHQGTPYEFLARVRRSASTEPRSPSSRPTVTASKKATNWSFSATANWSPSTARARTFTAF